MVYANGRKKSFNAVSVNNQRRFLINKEVELSKEEIFLESFEHGNYFYLVTVGWTTSNLFFYKFDSDINIETQRVELADLVFGVNEKGLYKNPLRTNGEESISNISYETINSLATTASQNKIYVFDNTFTLALDKHFGQTLILKINLQDWSKSLKKIAFESNNCEKSNSNSSLLHNWLFKSQVCDDQLRFSIFDYQTGVELSSFSVGSEEEIAFKNTPVIQEGGKTMFAAAISPLENPTNPPIFALLIFKR